MQNDHLTRPNQMCEEIGKIAVGTYDGLLYCYRLWYIPEGCTDIPEEIEGEHSNYYAKLLFLQQPHDRAVRSLAGASRYLACGGSDGPIAMYDLKTMKAAGYLTKHEDAVDTIQFFKNSWLISGSCDKSICLWRLHDSTMMKVLTGHTGALTTMAISPTGKFMLSGGRDGSLRMWDLLHGHNAKTRHIGVSPVFILFSEDSKEFMFGCDKEVHLVEGCTEQTLFTWTHDRPVSAACIKERTAWIGCVDGHLYAWNMDNGECMGEYVVSQDRIKFVHVVDKYVITMTSAGDVNIAVVDAEGEIDSVLQWNVPGRITCGAFMPNPATD